MLPKFLSIAIFFAVWIDRSLEEIFPCDDDIKCYDLAVEKKLNVGIVPILVTKGDDTDLEREISNYFGERIRNVKILKVKVAYGTSKVIASYLYYINPQQMFYPFLVVLRDNRLIKSLAHTILTAKAFDLLFTNASFPQSDDDYAQNRTYFLTDLKNRIVNKLRQKKGKKGLNADELDWLERNNDPSSIPPKVIRTQPRINLERNNDPSSIPPKVIHPQPRINLDLDLGSIYGGFNASTTQASVGQSSSGQTTQAAKRKRPISKSTSPSEVSKRRLYTIID